MKDNIKITFIVIVVIVFIIAIFGPPPRKLSERILPQSAEPEVVVVSTAKFEFRVANVHDGDTITGTIIFPWKVALVDVKIRAADYDAWETTKTRKTVTITDAEIIKGKEATTKLIELCKSSKIMVSAPYGNQFDAYGRNLAQIYYQKADGPITPLADWMKENKYIRE